MVTLYASAKRDGRGFKPMVMIRKANGQMIGSRVSRSLWFVTDDAARYFAKCAADKVARQLDFVRVAA